MGLVPVTTVDATGVHVPAFADVLAGLVGAYQSIYGSDTVLTPDTQDGQWLGIVASAVNDANAMAAAVYNAFSPSTAQGAGLSSIVKTNGLTRAVPTYSTVDQVIIGQAGAVITNGLTSDVNGNRWALPATVTIPLSGRITVTATCTTIGAVTASPGDVSTIATPTLGWQSVTNVYAAAAGAPVESDAALRRRQAISTALPSRSLLEGVTGAIAAIPGVVRFRAYENDTDAIDVNGVPGHALSFVVDGGDATAIATTIATKKGAGVGTFGTTIVSVSDAFGVARRIAFFRPTQPVIAWALTLKALPGFTTDVQSAIAQALSNWTNALGIGNSIYRTRAFVPANLGGGTGSTTFEVTELIVARDGGTPIKQDIPIAFNEAPFCVPANVSFTVTS